MAKRVEAVSRCAAADDDLHHKHGSKSPQQACGSPARDDDVDPAGADASRSPLDPTVSVGPWCEVHSTWPRSGNVIMALQDEHFLVVYAAFNKRIAQWYVLPPNM